MVAHFYKVNRAKRIAGRRTDSDLRAGTGAPMNIKKISETVKLGILICTLVISLGTAIVGSVAVFQVLAVKADVVEVHTLFNSRMDELLAITKREAHAKGVLDEKEREEQRK